MRKLIIVIALTIGADTVAIAQRPTTDIVGITSVTDGQGSVLDSVLLADGGVKKIVFTLKGSSRKYSAWNLDLNLPEGVTVTQTDGQYNIVLPTNSTLLPTGSSASTHHLYTNLLTDGNYRMACFSTTNESFRSEQGSLFVLDAVFPPSMKTGTYAVRLSNINLTEVTASDVNKFVPENCEITLKVVSAYDVFATYKQEQTEIISALSAEGDTEDVLAIIQAGKMKLDGLVYDEAKTLDEDKSEVSKIVEKTRNDVEAQRTSEQTAYAEHRTQVITEANSLATEGCSEKIREIVAAGVNAITGYEYNKSKTVHENSEVLDKLLVQLKKDVEEQLNKEAQLAADKAAFATYKQEQTEIVSALSAEGDTEDVLAIIQAGKTKLDGLVYDEAKTLDENKSEVSKIVEKTRNDVEAQRTSEQTAYAEHRTQVITEANSLATEGCSEKVREIVANGVKTLTDYEYDKTQTVHENSKALDELLTQLKKKVEDQLAKEAQLAADKATFAAYKQEQLEAISTLSKEGDTEEVLAIIQRGKTTLEKLDYNETKTLEENKSEINKIVENTRRDVALQRSSEQASYAEHRNQVLTEAKSLATEGCSDKVREIVEAGVSTIEAYEYDSHKTVYDNNQALDKLFAQLRKDVEAQLAIEAQLAADKATFATYKQEQAEAISALSQKGDTEDVLTIIQTGKTELEGVTYDETKTLDENKSEVNKIVEKTRNDVEAQRASEQTAYAEHRTQVITEAKSLATEGCSEKVREIVDNGVNAITNYEYNKAKTVHENSEALDKLLAQLKKDVEEQLNKEAQLAADKAAFATYKQEQTEIVSALSAVGDTEDVLAIIQAGKTKLDGLAYDEAKTLDENKSEVSKIVEKTRNDVEAQRASEQTAYAEHRTQVITEANSLATEGCSEKVREIVANGVNAITGYEYNKSKTVHENSEALDKLLAQLKKDVEDQLNKEAQLAADKAAFATYKQEQTEAVSALSAEGDTEDVLAIIQAGKTKLDGLVYDEAKTLDENKSEVNKIVEKTRNDVEAQRTSEQTAYAEHRTQVITEANSLATEGCSEKVREIVAAGVKTLTDYEYDKTLTVHENSKALDELLTQLKKKVEDQLAKEAQLAADKAAFATYKQEQTEIVSALSAVGDTEDVLAIIQAGKTKLDGLVYDEAKTLDENKSEVSKIVEKTRNDVEAQRTSEQTAYAEHRTQVITEANSLATEGCSKKIREIVAAGVNAITGYEYNKSKTVHENSEALDQLLVQLKKDVEEQLEKEAQLAADKATFATYKQEQAEVMDQLALENDPDTIKVLVAKTKDSLTALAYDEQLSLDENKAEVDSMVTLLQAEVEKLRQAVGISAASADERKRAYYNMSGVRVKRPSQKGVYIVNGKKVLINNR